MELTPSLAIDVGDFALDDGGVQETLVRNPQALGGLVLIGFARSLRGGDGFECGSGHCVIEDPGKCVSAQKQEGRIEPSLTGCCMTFQYGCQ